MALALVACGGSQRRAQTPADSEADAPEPASQSEAADESSPESDGRSCEQSDQWGPVMVSSEEYAARRGAEALTFRELATSQGEPAEVCGIHSQLELLVKLKCDDGSNPFGEDRDAAHQARSGSVGAGGRCGSIIDLYQISCPEQTYELYIDAYLCERGGAVTFDGD